MSAPYYEDDLVTLYHDDSRYVLSDLEDRSVDCEGHPTVKPLPMVADWVRLFTDPGDTILDPFAGSGTTLRAAKDEGRRAIGVELDERYCEVIARRLSQDCLFGGAA